ncbi:MAG: virulence RhuM family protein [Chitinispirillales bacterium]|nr:virulence RhuM family protein [Chitinispirillales bacterium]
MDKEFKFLIYSTPQDDVSVNVIVKNETVWLTQKAIAALFGTSRENITMHLKNVFESAELQEDSVCKKFLLTAADGKNYNTQLYNLDAIISVGYRVNSLKATAFRIWATKILKEFITKGFVLDDERLKQGQPRGLPVKRYVKVAHWSPLHRIN